MVNHGISTGALFLVAGMIFDRFATHDRTQMGGLAKSMPKLAFFVVLFAMSSIGLPGLNGFVSASSCACWARSASAARGTRCCCRRPCSARGTGRPPPWAWCWLAVYMLGMVNGLLFGPAKVPANRPGRSRSAT